MIDPVAFHIGPLKIYWYGLMYLFAFILCWLLARKRARSTGAWTMAQIDDLIFYCALGVILGGRLGYILFYEPSYFLANPLDIVKTWKGGMSFHGGMLGVITAMWLFAKKNQKPFFCLTDFIAPLVPIGLGLGRLGNFINGELWGRVTTLPWGMVFPAAGPQPRHPSQLYEAALEGVVLFIVLWWFSAKPRPRAAVSGLFLLGYGIMRFGVEFVRQPDAQLGFIALHWLTMGQLLSLPMILFGLVLLLWAYRHEKLC